MRLLIVTQVIDTEHPILGFFHRWVIEFAKHCEQVHVICLEAGTHNLPANVTVHSLGKEAGKGKLSYLLRFYQLIWSLRKEYDGVFVHMNQIYIILGAPLWRMWAKKIGLWYMHGSTPFSLKIAEKLAHTVFTGSSESFNVLSKKVVVTGHGIDIDKFKPSVFPKDIDLVTVGRITPSKNLPALIEVLTMLRQTHIVSLTIVGRAITVKEKAHEAELRALVAQKNLESSVIFQGTVSQADLPSILNRSKVFVTAAQNGSLDKAVLEAMACAVPVVSMAEGTRSLPLGSA